MQVRALRRTTATQGTAFVEVDVKMDAGPAHKPGNRHQIYRYLNISLAPTRAPLLPGFATVVDDHNGRPLTLEGVEEGCQATPGFGILSSALVPRGQAVNDDHLRITY